MYEYKNVTNAEIKIFLNPEIIVVKPDRTVVLKFQYEYPGLVLVEDLGHDVYNPGLEQERLNTTYVNLATFNPVVEQLNENDTSDVNVYNTLVSVSGSLQTQINVLSGGSITPAFVEAASANALIQANNYTDAEIIDQNIVSLVSSASANSYNQIINNGNSILSSSISGSVFRTQQDINSDTVNVRDFGAVGDGITDDTLAINAAFSASNSVMFNPGTYIYDGAGIDMNGKYIYGIGKPVIQLGTGKSFLTGSGFVDYCYMEGMVFQNGYGAIRHLYTGISVARGVKIINCDFFNYTNAAISINASDWPYWRLDGCTFHAANDITSIGVALAGDNAGSVIRRCSFENNAIHIKHSGNGWNLYIENNDFIRYEAYSGTPRIDIWCEPLTVDNSDALFLRSNKFGNENLASSGEDYRILFADEGSGTENSNRFPSYTTSTGRIANVTCTGNTQGGRDPNTPCFVTTYTQNIWQLLIDTHTLNGTPPDYIVKIEAPITTSNYLAAGNTISLAPGWNGIPSSSTKVTTPCNIPGFFIL